jgi:hypothetical protein
MNVGIVNEAVQFHFWAYIYRILSTLQKGVVPADLLKLRQMETQGIHIKEVLSWLFRWTRRAAAQH